MKNRFGARNYVASNVLPGRAAQVHFSRPKRRDREGGGLPGRAAQVHSFPRTREPIGTRLPLRVHKWAGASEISNTRLVIGGLCIALRINYHFLESCFLCRSRRFKDSPAFDFT